MKEIKLTVEEKSEIELQHKRNRDKKEIVEGLHEEMRKYTKNNWGLILSQLEIYFEGRL
jgi:hypothetical protein